MGSIPHWPTRYISGLWHMGYPVTEENPWKSMVSRKNDIHIDLYFHLSHIYIYNLLAILDFFLVISVINICLAGKGHLSHSQVRFLWYSMFSWSNSLILAANSFQMIKIHLAKAPLSDFQEEFDPIWPMANPWLRCISLPKFGDLLDPGACLWPRLLGSLVRVPRRSPGHRSRNNSPPDILRRNK